MASSTETPSAGRRSSGGRVIGMLWLYTFLRAVIFGVLFGLLWLLGLKGLLGALVALVLSVPLSMVLLARPRARLAAGLEGHTDARRERQDVLRKRLNGEIEDVPDEAEGVEPSGADSTAADSGAAGSGDVGLGAAGSGAGDASEDRPGSSGATR
jgi:hypothetical protein